MARYRGTTPTVPEKANQTEAEAGTDNTKYMTALGTQQAIGEALGSGVLSHVIFFSSRAYNPSQLSTDAIINVSDTLDNNRSVTFNSVDLSIYGDAFSYFNIVAAGIFLAVSAAFQNEARSQLQSRSLEITPAFISGTPSTVTFGTYNFAVTYSSSAQTITILGEFGGFSDEDWYVPMLLISTAAIDITI